MNKKLSIGIIIALALLINILSVAAISNVRIQETTLTMDANPSSSASTVLNVENNGAELLGSVALSASDLSGPDTISASQIAFSPSPLAINAGESESSQITINVPANQKAGAYTGVAIATYNETEYDEANIELTVNQVEGLSAGDASKTIAQGDSGVLNIEVQNTGNHDASVTYQIDTLTDSNSNTLSYSTNKGSLSPAYGGTDTLTLTFNVPSPQPAGTYEGDITFTWGSASETVHITVTVREPMYSVDMPDVLHEEADIEDTVQTTVTITNDGDYQLTGISMGTSSGSESTITNENEIPSTLNVGASFQVDVETEIDDDVKGNEETIIGDLKFQSDQVTEYSDIKVQIGNKLNIDRVKISFDDSSWETIEDGDKYDEDDARPGARFEMEMKLENLFDDDAGLDMEDCNIEVYMYDLGEDGDDLEGDADEFDIDAGEDSEDILIDFDDERLGWEIDTGEHEVEIRVEAEDENGGTHHASLNFTIDIQRENDPDFVFERVDVSPSTVRAGSSFTLRIDGKSIGEDGDDEAQLRISSVTLGINERKEFEIGGYDEDDCDALEDSDPDECNEFSYAKTFRVPSDIAEGSYPLKVEIYNDGGDDKTDQEDILVKVIRSSDSSSDSDSGSDPGSSDSGSSDDSSDSSRDTSDDSSDSGSDSGTQRPSDVTTTPGNVQVYYGPSQGTEQRTVSASEPTRLVDTTKAENEFQEGTLYLALLSIAGVILIVAIIALIAYAASGSKPKP